MDIDRQSRKIRFLQLLDECKREKWAKISSRFAKSDRPAGCKLTAVGCIQRFEHSRDEERMDRCKSMALERGSSREERLERERMSMITPDMNEDTVMSILSGEHDEERRT